MSNSPTVLSAKRILDTQGRRKTLSSGLYSFIKLNCRSFNSAHSQETEAITPTIKRKILFLGLGYNACTDVTSICKKTEHIYYIECVDFEMACQEAGIALNYPNNFTKITRDELYAMFKAKDCYFSDWEFFLYKQNLSLFPEYWNEVLITLDDIFTTQYDDPSDNSTDDAEDIATQELDTAQPASKNTLRKTSIFIAGSSQDLMFKELCDATYAIDYDYITMDTCLSDKNPQANKDAFSKLISLLKSRRPDLFLSINGRNLDTDGRVFYQLKQLNIPIALWIVDNPWNILSKFKQNWWQECTIYVTDSSFIPALKAHGAKHVYYLPLATSTHSMHYEKSAPSTHLLYVAHSSFKNKDKFFSAVDKENKTLSVCKNKIDKHFELLEEKRPSTLIDFHSIYTLLYPTNDKRLWPGNDFRTVNHLTTETDNYQKAHWIDELTQHISIIGDKGWQEILKKALTLIPPVDYYTQLPAYYANAKFTMNITSMLMPSALTQRHFDVWVSDGFLVSSPTHGMAIFESDIVDAFTAKSPQELLLLTDKYSTNNDLYNEIKAEMKNIIFANHFYSSRLQSILDHI